MERGERRHYKQASEQGNNRWSDGRTAISRESAFSPTANSIYLGRRSLARSIDPKVLESHLDKQTEREKEPFLIPAAIRSPHDAAISYKFVIMSVGRTTNWRARGEEEKLTWLTERSALGSAYFRLCFPASLSLYLSFSLSFFFSKQRFVFCPSERERERERE